MDYFQKTKHPPHPDLTWNLPEQHRGTIKVIGGSSNSFRTEIKTAEFLARHYPIENSLLVLPDSLKPKLPSLPNAIYIGSTDSGSFKDAKALADIINTPDYNLLLGDLSKNSVTAEAIHSVLSSSSLPALITRDTIDLIIEHRSEPILMNSQIVLFVSMPQLQKLFRTIYYPKMLLLSGSLIQVADALHKFTLSYPTKVITLHNGQILVATNGEVKAIPLAKSGYLPLTIWNGELAAKIATLNLFNPDRFIDATLSAIFHDVKS